MKTEVLNQIKLCAHSTQANLANMQIHDADVREIMQTIKRVQPDISVINLDGNELSDKGARILTKYIPDFPKIKELSLQFNNIDEEGAISLFSLRKKFTHLDILFHGNKIYDEGRMMQIEQTALKK